MRIMFCDRRLHPKHFPEVNLIKNNPPRVVRLFSFTDEETESQSHWARFTGLSDGSSSLLGMAEAELSAPQPPRPVACLHLDPGTAPGGDETANSLEPMRAPG